MNLLDSIPSPAQATTYLLGAVAFHRCFYAVYDEMNEMGYDIAEGKNRLEDVIQNPGSRAYQTLAGELKQMMGVAASKEEFNLAARGFLAEADSRYVTRAAELEIVRMQERLSGLQSFDDVSFQDAAAHFL